MLGCDGAISEFLNFVTSASAQVRDRCAAEEMTFQAEDEQVCNTGKGEEPFAQQRRKRSGGILAAVFPCMYIADPQVLFGMTSLTQVFFFCLTLTCLDSRLKYIIYDNACGLLRFLRNARRALAQRTPETKHLVEQVVLAIDRFHEDGHTACLDPQHPGYLPNIRAGSHPALDGCNTQTCEESNAWIARYNGIASRMSYVNQCVFLYILFFYRNRHLARTADRRIQLFKERRAAAAKERERAAAPAKAPAPPAPKKD